MSVADKKIGFGFKGKYCSSCNTVWEVIKNEGSTVGVVRYPDFPSYGLEREDCSKCTEVAPNPKETAATLAQERHKDLLQKIAEETQELIRKNETK